VSLNKAHFFEKLTTMRLTVQYRGGPSRFLTEFETIVTDMENTLGEDMKDSDKVGFLTTAIAGYQPFHSIKASLDTNAMMTRQDITYDGMLQVLYNNCPTAIRQSRSVNNLNSKHRPRGRGPANNDDAWKKDYTLWVILGSELSSHKADVFNEALLQHSRSEGSIKVLSLLSVG